MAVSWPVPGMFAVPQRFCILQLNAAMLPPVEGTCTPMVPVGVVDDVPALQAARVVASAMAAVTGARRTAVRIRCLGAPMLEVWCISVPRWGMVTLPKTADGPANTQWPDVNDCLM